MKLDEIFSFENLYKAHKKCRLSKQHKGEVIRFEINLAANIYNIIKEISNKKYKIGKYKEFIVYEPKKRLIKALPYKDRVILSCFCENSLIPKIEKKLIYDNVACRKDKGTLFGIKRLEKMLKKEFFKENNNHIYYLKCDIKKYFPSINHNILLSLLNKIGFSNDEMWFINKLLKEETENSIKGLPLGNQSSQWFSLLYLDKVDRLVKEKLQIKGYVRYMDDFILVSRDKKYLRYCLEEIKRVCREELDLELNSKTHIGLVRDGIDFLGYRHILNDKGKVIRKLTKSSKKRMKKHIKILHKLKNKNVIDNKYIDMRINSFKSHISISNEKYIENLLNEFTKKV